MHRRIFDDTDKRQIALTSGGIEAVADDEFVRDDESPIIDFQFFFDTRFGFVEKARDFDRSAPLEPRISIRRKNVRPCQ